MLVILHHSKNGIIMSSIKQIMYSAREKNKDVIICSAYISKNEINFCKSINIKYLKKNNFGRDFGSLKNVYNYLRNSNQLKKIDRLIVLNTSMVSLDKVSVDDKWFQFLENQQEDFVGITDSLAENYHIQTYHFSLSNYFLNSNEFRNFIFNFNEGSKSKRYVIKNGELRLSKIAQKYNFSMKTFFACTELNKLNYLNKFSEFIIFLEKLFPNQPNWKEDLDFFVKSSVLLKSAFYNPSHYRWQELILEGYPFLKRELLESNPIGRDIFPYLIPLSQFLKNDVDNSILSK